MTKRISNRTLEEIRVGEVNYNRGYNKGFNSALQEVKEKSIEEIIGVYGKGAGCDLSLCEMNIMQVKRVVYRMIEGLKKK